MPEAAQPQPLAAPSRQRVIGFAAILAVYCLVVFVIPKPASVKPEGWRLTGIFLAAVVGSILQPVPGGALVLLAVTLAALIGGLPMQSALAGWSDPSVWLVLAAFFISRALINTGLAKRIALFFVRVFGKSSLGISYALSLADAVLAAMIPSNGARSGGVILPIVRSIAELYGSFPGSSAPLIGSFLMTAVYQGVCITAAMFLTGQASNPLAANMAKNAGYEITWTGWLVAGIVPGLLSLLVVPWLVMRVNPPAIRHTPEAAEFASTELRKMGSLGRNEWILTAVFVSVCALWASSGATGFDITAVALLGAVTLLFTDVLQWEDVVKEKGAWDLFIWYGGFVRLGKALNDTGVTTEFAKGVAESMSGADWAVLFAVALLVYFYAHYAFASITAHMLAMYPPFLAILLLKGAPIGLVAFSFACFANLAAGLTNYGTTPSPMFFAHGYVPLKTWWKVGFVASAANLAIWGTVGFGWWKLIGVW